MIEIIPAIDLIDGKCVRLAQGDFSRKTSYPGDPLEVARRFEDANLRRLHIVDLDGARTGTPANLRVLEDLANQTELTIDFGGGIKTETDLTDVFNAGAAIANIGSLAVRKTELFLDWLGKYGKDRFLLGADVKNGMLTIDGWQTSTDLPVVDFLQRYSDQGVATAFVTEVSRDGVMEGPATELYRTIRSNVPALQLIASGGVRSTSDIDELDRIGCTGVIIGKALYEGHIQLEELSKYAG